jgi:hypothetical protein
MTMKTVAAARRARPMGAPTLESARVVSERR